MQPRTDQYGRPIQPTQGQQVYGQPPQQMVIGQTAPVGGQPMMGAQPAVGMGLPGMGLPATSATTALVLSILSIFCGGICLAIPALIVAKQALAVTDQYPSHPDAGTAKAALIISWVVIGLTLAVVVIYALMFGVLIASDGGGF